MNLESPRGDAGVAVLIVDDSFSKRLALTSALIPLGHLIVEADSGVAALRCVMAQDFAVILLDVCMPGTNGYETAALIRGRDKSAMTPIIFITASASDEIASGGLYAEGAVDVIFAPVSPVELRAKVSVFVNLFIKAQALAADARHSDRRTRAAEVSLTEREADTRAILEAATDAFVSTDAAGTITGWNRHAREMFGWTESEALGRQAFDTIFPHRLSAGLDRELTAFLATGDRRLLNERREISVLHRDGREFPAELTSWPVRAGDTWGFNALLHDITARKLAEAELASARDEALEASRMKSQFLANMSHELRTPMNGVLGMTSLLLGTDLTAEQRDFAETATQAAGALMAILNDLLDFSEMEAGRLGIESVEFDVRHLVEDVVGALRVPAQEKSLDLACSLCADVPSVLRGDPGRLRQIVTNLLANAVKFTPSGAISVSMTMDDFDDTTITTRFEVTDTGIGMDPADQAAMFEPFSQADDSDTRTYGGAGLGLAISRHLVEVMGGKIGVRSVPGHGSTFWFTIPLQRVHSEQAQTAA
jgi:PAS domain S-box-containing protein